MGTKTSVLPACVTLPCTRTAVLGRSAGCCQIIRQCLSPESGKRCLIHPRQLHEAAVWDLSGGGLEPKAFMWKCYFCSMHLVGQQWHFDALFHLKPSHTGYEAARRGRVHFQRTNSRRGWETLPQTRHRLSVPSGLLPGA